MDRKQLSTGLEFLNDLSKEEQERFYAMSEEEQKKCITENLLSHQDEEMWARNDGISQLEGRIATDSFQG